MSALARWDGVLAEIAERHRHVLAAGEAVARQLVVGAAGGGDYQPVVQQVAAVEARLQEVEAKIEETWRGQIDDAIVAEGHDAAVREAQFARGRVLRHALDDARDELRTRVFAELARRRQAHALAQHQPVPCRRCGALLVTALGFHAVDLTCPTCRAVTLWQPPELMLSAATLGAHAVAQEAALPEWRAMRAAERALHAVRPPRPLAPLQAYERAQLAYWRAYLKARARFEPALARDPELEIRKRMEQWYVYSAEFEDAWVAAGRPRSPI